MSSPKTTPTLETVELLLGEVAECYRPFEKLRQKLSRLRRGSEAYLDLLAELEVAAEVLRTKAEHAGLAIEEFAESLPETD